MKTNIGVCQVVDRTVYKAVFGAVDNAVFGAMDVDVYSVVERAVQGAVYWVVYRAVYLPVWQVTEGVTKHDPSHPALNDFLIEINEERE